MAYTVDELITSIQKRGILPTDDNTLGESDILRFAHEELISYIAPLIKEMKEGYFENYEDLSIETNKVKYPISYRAMLGLVRDVVFIDTDGSERSLPRINLADKPDILNDQSSTGDFAFYVSDNSVVLHPKPSESRGSLRIYFYMRPNQLVKLASAGRIVSFNTTAKTVELATLPSGFVVGADMDFIKGKAGFECLDWDLAPTNVSGTTLTFTSLPENLKVGDYVCLAEQSCFPQIPVEAHPMLAQTVVVRMLDALTHTEALNNALGKLKKMEELLPKLLGNRVDGEPTAIRIRNNLLDYTRK